MIEKGINRIVELVKEQAAGKPFEYNGLHYYRKIDGSLVPIDPRRFSRPDLLTLHTLSGLVGYIQERADFENNAFLLVEGVGSVSLLGALQPDNDNSRFLYAKAKLPEAAAFSFNTYMDLENFIIRLQTQFVPGPTVERIIVMLAHVANDHVATATDDRFTQKLAVKTGITTKEEVRVENPVLLAPYRTFREVEQPELPFVLRLKNTPDGIAAALFEAGGETWRLTAMQRIAEYMRGHDGMPPVFA